MKYIRLTILFIFIVSILSSCGDSIPIEDYTISLILGLDLDEENNLLISESNPVFSKEAKSKIETYELKGKSVRESVKHFNALTEGKITAAKIQVLLIGKRVIEHEKWFSLLDTVYRNPTFSLNTKVIIVDGPVSDIIFYKPEDKPQLPLYLSELIDKNIETTRALTSTLQVLHREMYEKGQTPTISEIRKDKDIKFAGMALLGKTGKYVDTLNLQETSLLLVLKNDKEQQLTFSLPMTELNVDDEIFHKNELSFDVNQVKSKVKTKFRQDKFHFNYKIKMDVTVAEGIFSVKNVNRKKLEKMIEKELTKKFKDLIKKIQENKIDPMGLGLYARAYHYDQYKKIEDHWGETLSESNIDVSVEVKIVSEGAIR